MIEEKRMKRSRKHEGQCKSGAGGAGGGCLRRESLTPRVGSMRAKVKAGSEICTFGIPASSRDLVQAFVARLRSRCKMLHAVGLATGRDSFTSVAYVSKYMVSLSHG